MALPVATEIAMMIDVEVMAAVTTTEAALHEEATTMTTSDEVMAVVVAVVAKETMATVVDLETSTDMKAVAADAKNTEPVESDEVEDITIDLRTVNEATEVAVLLLQPVMKPQETRTAVVEIILEKIAMAEDK